MTTDQCKPGALVWAACGCYGWRPAVVVEAVTEDRIRIRFESGCWGAGCRAPGRLRPRDPRLRGKDKPSPLDAERAYATQGPPAA